MEHLSLRQRGVGYVAVQALLIGLIVFGPRGFFLLPKSMLSWLPYLQILGACICILGLLLSLIAALNLGKNLTPLPCPRDGGELVQVGLYRIVRHPLYFGVLLVAFGWLLIYPHLFVLIYVICLCGFFDIKTRREEIWLLERFPNYSDYQTKVKKLIPGCY